MKVNGLIISLVFTVCTIFAVWFLTRPETSCSVWGGGRKELNGFYSAQGGIYVKQGIKSTYNPDFFQILEMKRHYGTSYLGFAKQMWFIADASSRDPVYVNRPEHPEDNLSRPPSRDWKAVKAEDERAPLINDCVGSLENSAPINAAGATNIGELMQRPVTTALLTLIFAIAYYLWAYKVEVSAVAYSYEAVVVRGEYWRIVTASFAHFDLLHLGFNTMSLYQLGSLEAVYGSATFLYLNAALVVVTMLICTAIYHVMITRYGRTGMYSQQAVGFSCVLFAWMVAVSALQPQFCPIFILPKVCVQTWFLPLPAALSRVVGVVSLPLNLGPFVLLIFTKLILPRSSFVGHLSGILIGYPVAWGMLHWLTLPVLLSGCVWGYLYLEKALVWQLPGFWATNFDLDSFTTAGMLRNYKIAYIVSCFLLCSVLAGWYFMGPAQALIRLSTALLAIAAVHACRMEWIATAGGLKETCSLVMCIGVLCVFGLFVYDGCNLVATRSNQELLIGCTLGINYVRIQVQHLMFVMILELVYVVLMLMNLLEMRSATPLLAKFRFDLNAVVEDMMILTCTSAESLNNSGTGGVVAFSGTANRLVHAQV